MASAATLEKPAWLSITEAARWVGRTPDTIWGWIRHGVKASCGVVKLPAEKLGGRWVTTRESIEEFMRACTGDGRPVAANTPAAEARRGKREQQRAQKALGGKRS